MRIASSINAVTITWAGLLSSPDRFRALVYRNNHILGKKDYPLARVIAGEEFSEVIVDATPAADA